MVDSLPSGWESYSPSDKINYFNSVGITPDQMLSAGVGQGDIDWMLQNGYNGGAAPSMQDQLVWDSSAGEAGGWDTRSVNQQWEDQYAEDQRRAALNPVQQQLEDLQRQWQQEAANTEAGFQSGLQTGNVNINGQDWMASSNSGNPSTVHRTSDNQPDNLPKGTQLIDIYDPETGQITQDIQKKSQGAFIDGIGAVSQLPGVSAMLNSVAPGLGFALSALGGAARGDWGSALTGALQGAGAAGFVDPSFGQYANLANQASKGNWLGAATGAANMAGGLGGLSNMLGGGGGGTPDTGIYNDYALEDFEHLTGDTASNNWQDWDRFQPGSDWQNTYSDVYSNQDLEDLGGYQDNADLLGSSDNGQWQNTFQADTYEGRDSGGLDGEFHDDLDIDTYDPFQGGGGEIGGGGNMVGGGGDALFDTFDDYDPFQGQGGEIGGGGNMVGGGGDALFDTIDTYDPFQGGGGEIGGGGNLTGGGWQGPTGVGGRPTGPTGPAGTPPPPPGSPQPPGGGLGGLTSMIGAVAPFMGGRRPGGSRPPVSPPPKPPVSPPPGGTQPPGGSQPPPPGTPGGGVMGGVGGNIGSGGTGLYSMQPLMQNQGQNIKSSISNQGATGLYNPTNAVNQFAQSWNPNAATNPAQGQGGAMARGGLAHFADGGSAIDPMGSTPMASPSYYSFGSPSFHNFGEAGAYADGGEVLSDIEDLVRQKLFMDQNAKQMQQHQQASGIQPTAPVQAFAGGGSAHPMGEPLFMSEGASVNHYVQGPGTGQSDDIPAMLADGEYVLDAETVAALGDGSNKAGAQVLDQWRQQIRAHKRGGGLASIPPKSLGPDGYMAKVRGGM